VLVPASNLYRKSGVAEQFSESHTLPERVSWKLRFVKPRRRPPAYASASNGNRCGSLGWRKMVPAHGSLALSLISGGVFSRIGGTVTTPQDFAAVSRHEKAAFGKRLLAGFTSSLSTCVFPLEVLLKWLRTGRRDAEDSGLKSLIR